VRRNAARLALFGTPLFGQQAIDVPAHLLKKLIAAELPGVAGDLFGIDLQTSQAADGGRDRLDGLLGEENP
jgi:hypothetical protein